MTLRRSFRPLRPDLDKFLFAAVGDQIDGIPLSMISALTRLGLDPWQEAGRLSSLARREAVEQLARLIAEIPGVIRPVGEARERLPIAWLVYCQSTTTAVQRPRKSKSARHTADRRFRGRRSSGLPVLCSRQPCWSAPSSTADLCSELEFHKRSPKTGPSRRSTELQEVAVSVRLKIENSREGLVATISQRDDTGKVIGLPSVSLVGSKEEAKQRAKTLARSLGLKLYGIVDKTGAGDEPRPWLVPGVGNSV
jgi:hypothetical protein